MDCTPSQHAGDAMANAAPEVPAAATTTATASSAHTQAGGSADKQPGKPLAKDQTQMEVDEGEMVCPGPTSAALLVHFVPKKILPEFLYPLLNMRVPVAVLHLLSHSLSHSSLKASGATRC
jgi:hypothetical protein